MGHRVQGQGPDPDFMEAVANCVHDIKNSAGALVHSADSIPSNGVEPETRPQLAALQVQARQINQHIMQLLALHKTLRSEEGISPAIVDCGALVIELAADNELLLEARGIKFLPDHGDPVEGYFDRELVIEILNSVINSAQRHAKSAVRLSCCIDDGYIVLAVEDDGNGYPEELLGRSDVDVNSAVSAKSSGSTGSALLFARRIAELHRYRDRIGCVTLSNDGIDGGASFRLWLP
jgi:signal transduction histidine kinase